MKGIQWVAAGSLVVALAGCGLTSASSTDPVLATVNGKAITTQDWKTAMDGLSILQGQQIATSKADKYSQVEQLVVWSALEQWALKQHLTTPAKAATSATSLLSQFTTSAGGTKQFSSELKTYHLTKSSFLNFLTGQEELQAAFTRATKNVPAPSAASIKSYYASNKSQFETPPEDDIRMIIVKTDSEAKSLETRLQGGASFAALAKAYSTNKTSAAQGGQVGEVPLSTSSGAPSALVSLMQTLKAGQYGIADVSGSYYLIQVEKVTPAAYEALKTVSAQIKSTLTQETDNQVFQDFGQSLESKDHVHLDVKS